MKLIHKYCWIILVFVFSCGEKVKRLHVETIALNDTTNIVLLEDSLVRPILYNNIPDLSGLPVDESKEKFFALTLPSVLIARYHINTVRDSIILLTTKEKWSKKDSTLFLREKQRFKAGDINNLLERMITHPNSITLAQAAVESGWGSSRFFRQANNLFGIWAYNKDEPRIAANNNQVYLRKYDDISESIEDYFVTLGRARPYSEFRKARQKTNDINILLPFLRRYSQRGAAYVHQLKTIIRQNDLTKYDDYKLDPKYFKEE
ncbi:glucosaminidase domain-containing protein [Fulvivirga lutimaris]|uniref:glucosaminidase domain-containing protein n=1 Tax=Fulvivirga lutimaris TaxID=1819566 RepID=UPI0012BBC2B5|nr:glucosaminidase domain-containing protein [Fulvivirga lutimaris]MTI39274.1 hypothetical protein [Fulvivirga lutimaris]